MGHDVGSPFKRTAVYRCGEGVVDNEGHAVAVGDAGKLLDVEHLNAGVGNGFAEQGLRVGAEGTADFLLVGIRIDKRAVDAHLLHRHAKKVERATVDGRGAHHVAARLTDVIQGIKIGRLARRGKHGAHAAFERGNLGRHGVRRGVLQAGIEISALFEVKQAGHLLAGAVFESRALIDGKHARFAVLGRPSGLHAQGAGILFFLH